MENRTEEIVTLLNSTTGNPWLELIPRHRLEGAESEDVTPAQVADSERAGEYDTESFLASSGHKLYRLPGGQWQDGGPYDFARIANQTAKWAVFLRSRATAADARADRLEELAATTDGPDGDLFEEAADDSRIVASQRRTQASKVTEEAATYAAWARHFA